MANICDYSMKITGNINNALRLTRMIQQRDAEYFIGRGGSVYIDEEDDEYIVISGDCKWSVLSAMIDNAISMKSHPERWYWGSDGMPGIPITLIEASKILDLTIEAFSSECGCQFMEHFVIDKGNCIINDCIDWSEYDIDGFANVEEVNAEYGTNFTSEQFNNAVDGYISIGGIDWIFDNWR